MCGGCLVGRSLRRAKQIQHTTEPFYSLSIHVMLNAVGHLSALPLDRTASVEHRKACGGVTARCDGTRPSTLAERISRALLRALLFSDAITSVGG